MPTILSFFFSFEREKERERQWGKGREGETESKKVAHPHRGLSITTLRSGPESGA